MECCKGQTALHVECLSWGSLLRNGSCGWSVFLARTLRRAPGRAGDAHLLHVLKDGRRCHRGRGFLDDLLVPPLDGAVPAEQGNGVPILVSQDLDFKVAGVLQELHHEDGGPGDLALHLWGEGQENQTEHRLELPNSWLKARELCLGKALRV